MMKSSLFQNLYNPIEDQLSNLYSTPLALLVALVHAASRSSWKGFLLQLFD